jgi:carboxylesterase type B
MFVHGAFPLTMSKAVYWMFVGALFKDSASGVLKHYRVYVEQVEFEAQQIAERQLLEEEHRQYYLEHQEELEEDYAWLLAQNKKLEEGEAEYSQVVSPETVDQLVQSFNSGGGDQGKNLTWWRHAASAIRGLAPKGNSSFPGIITATSNSESPWWQRAVAKLTQQPNPVVMEERRLAREARIKEKVRQRALKEATKVVVDYRPVMSRIINDYLFRCPSWHFAHLLSRNRVRKEKTNNVYVYRFSQPTHVPGYKECWGKVRWVVESMCRLTSPNLPNCISSHVTQLSYLTSSDQWISFGATIQLLVNLLNWRRLWLLSIPIRT